MHKVHSPDFCLNGEDFLGVQWAGTSARGRRVRAPLNQCIEDQLIDNVTIQSRDSKISRLGGCVESYGMQCHSDRIILSSTMGWDTGLNREYTGIYSRMTVGAILAMFSNKDALVLYTGTFVSVQVETTFIALESQL